MKLSSVNPFLIRQLLAAACITSAAHAATATKSGTGTELTLGANWTGGSGPGFPTSADIATWDSTSLGAGLTVGSAVNWGSINITDALTDIDITGAGTITTGTITLAGTRTLSIANNIALSGSSIYDIADVTGSTATDATLSGVISGAFALTKSGAGTLVLSNANLYTGGTTISGGILNISNAAALNTTTGTIKFTGGTLQYGTGITTDYSGRFTTGTGQSFSVDTNGNNVTFATAIQGAGNTFTKLGAGTLSVTSNTNSYTGTTTITGGTLQLGNNTTTGRLATGSAIVNDSVLAFNRSNAVVQGTDFSAAAITGTGAVTQLGSSTLTLNAANSFSGGVNINAGTVSVAGVGNSGANSNLGTNGTINIGATATGGILVYTGTGETSDKVINLAGTTGGATITQSGTNLLKFTSALTATGVGAKTLTLQGSTAGTGDISGAIVDSSSGATAVTKTGTGTWTLSGSNSYTGTTTISGGTLALSGGNNRLATAGTVSFTANGTLGLGATEQSLANLTLANSGTTGLVTGTTGGKLTLTGSSVAVGSTTSQTLNLSGLPTFVYNNAAGTLRVSGTSNSGGGVTGTLTLASTTNTITASVFGVGDSLQTSNTSVNVGTVNLGATNTINANTIAIGGNRASGTLQYLSGTNTSLTLRGSDGTSRVTLMSLSEGGGPAISGQQGTVNLTSNVTGTSTLDAMITTLNIGDNTRASSAGTNTVVNTATFIMGAGTLDATNIVIGNIRSGLTSAGSSSSMTGTFTLGGGSGTAGTVKVGTMTLGDNNSAFSMALSATFDLNNGGTLKAQTIQAGDEVAGGSPPVRTRTINWNDGTIKNYDSGTNLSITSTVTGTAALKIKLAGTGTHTFDIDSGRTGSVSAALVDATTLGTVAKAGAGTLTLSGANTYTGDTSVNAGTLNLTGSLTSAISVASGATLTGTGTTTGNITLNAGSNIIASGTGVQGADVTANATTNIFVTGAPTGSPATVAVIRHTGTMTGLANFNTTNYRAGSITDASGTVSLTYTGEAKTWNGTAGTWDVGTSDQWTGGSDAKFYWGDSVAFGNIAADRIVTLNGKLAPASIAVSNAANTYTFSGSGEITGPGSLTKSGAGTLILGTTNTYTGATTISGGTLSVGTSANLGAAASNLVFDGGTLQITGTDLTSFSTTGHTVSFNATKTVGLDITNAANTFTVDQVLNQTTGGFTKLGAGKVILNQANTYTGTTAISAGTLALSGGNNRLATTGTMNFSAAGTLDVGSTSQTLANLTVADGVTGTVMGTAGTLILGANNFLLGGTASGTSALNLSGLGNFQFNGATKTFQVGDSATTGATSTSTLTLAGANTITALNLFVGDAGALGSSTLARTATLNLGTTNTINATTINVGKGTSSTATVQFSAGLDATMLTIRGTAGGSSRADMLIGSQGTASSPAATAAVTGLVDLTNVNGTGGGTLDAMIGTLTVGQYSRTGVATSGIGSATGTFKMGAGTLDATTIIVGQDTSGGAVNSGATVAGTFTTGSGTVRVGTLTIGDKRSTSNTIAITSNFDLSNGGILEATTIADGANAATNVTRNFNWNDGTIKNIAGGNLAISSTATGAQALKIKLASTGTHTFDIDANRTGTVSAQLIDATTGGTLAKAGAGTLILTGSNTYTGTTTISAGTLSVTSLANGGSASGIGQSANAASNLVIDGGTLKFTGTTGNGSTDRLLTVGTNGATIDASSSDNTALTFTNAGSIVTTAGATDRTVTLTGTTAAPTLNTFTSVIVDPTGGGKTLLNKSGENTWVLAGANTYTGATTVSAGALVVNGSLSASSAVSVVSKLYGTGTIGGTTTILASGTYSAGAQADPGQQTFSNALTYTAGSIFEWDLDAAASDPTTANAGTYDKVIANGAVTGNSVFTVVLGLNNFGDAFWDTGKTWNNIFSTTGGGTFNLSTLFTNFGGAGVASNGLVAGQGQFTFTGNTLSWSAVPEPTSALAGLLIGAGLLRRKRRPHLAASPV